ncbi:MAG: hypothetical protein Q7R54_03665 [bacterium]|nr:hypothetical protein [bacterium]
MHIYFPLTWYFLPARIYIVLGLVLIFIPLTALLLVGRVIVSRNPWIQWSFLVFAASGLLILSFPSYRWWVISCEEAGGTAHFGAPWNGAGNYYGCFDHAGRPVPGFYGN